MFTAAASQREIVECHHDLALLAAATVARAREHHAPTLPTVYSGLFSSQQCLHLYVRPMAAVPAQCNKIHHTWAATCKRDKRHWTPLQ